MANSQSIACCKQSSLVVWAQAVSLWEMGRGSGGPRRVASPQAGHMLFAMAYSNGSKDEVLGETQSPLINQPVCWSAASLRLPPA